MVFNITFNNISVISWLLSFIGGEYHPYPIVPSGDDNTRIIAIHL
jgi:hypothetical protein